MKREYIALDRIDENNGQIDGIPANPREWNEGDVARLAKSIEETPELLEARGLIVVEQGERYIVLGGNLRLAALKRLKQEVAPCIILPSETEPKTLREIVIKDNGSFGAWDFEALQADWSDLPLDEWGVKAPEGRGGLKETEKLSEFAYKSMYYTPVEDPKIKLSDCVETSKFEAKIKAIEESELSDDAKELMRLFAYRFIRIDFEACANYYYFNASEEEKSVMERLRLVLTDDGLEGFIEDELIKIDQIAQNYE